MSAVGGGEGVEWCGIYLSTNLYEKTSPSGRVAIRGQGNLEHREDNLKAR